MAKWSYEGPLGPAHWGEHFKPAAGQEQSPIDICTASAEFDEHLAATPLSFSYDENCFRFVENTGSSFNVTGTPEAHSNVHGGPVKNNYKFLQFHIHWGKGNNEGSEHTVDGHSSEAELHIVNWNTDLYKTPGEAASSDKHDGLIVLGVMLKVGHANSELEKIVSSLRDVQFKGQKVALKETLNIAGLLPENPEYWTYKGSLTTPPCFESVQWVVFRDQLELSEEQLEAFRNLNNVNHAHDCCEGSKIKYNFRPVCPLNERKVTKSFD